MAFKKQLIKQKMNNNIVVYGAPMSGKSTYVFSQIDPKKTIFISTDGNALEGSQAYIAENWEDLCEAVNDAISNSAIDTISLDVLDDAVRFADAKAQRKLGMTHRADAKGGYGKLSLDLLELLQENIIFPLAKCDKTCYFVMHAEIDDDGEMVPSFGGYKKDSIALYNYLLGRCQKVIECTHRRGTYNQEIKAQRTLNSQKEGKN